MRHWGEPVRVQENPRAMRTTLGSVSAAPSPRGRRLATTVAALAPRRPAARPGRRGAHDPRRRARRRRERSASGTSGTPDNPLVRPWGVYQGPAEMPWLPYLGASETSRPCWTRSCSAPRRPGSALAAQRDITDRVETYLELTTGGDPEVLAQMTIFRMVPWEREACDRLPTAAEQAVVHDWIDGFAAGVGDTHLAVVMQPDAPFGLCAPGGSQLPAAHDPVRRPHAQRAAEHQRLHRGRRSRLAA